MFNKPFFHSKTAWLCTLTLLLLCLLFAYPFLWMFFATFKDDPDIFTPFPLWPKTFSLAYYHELLNGKWIPYPLQFLNSLWIAFAETLGALLITVPASYVLGRFNFKGAKIIYALAVLVVLIPRQVMVLPLFLWMNSLHLLDKSAAVILPGMVSGIGIIYFTQVSKRLPKPLIDLARSEGASEYQIFFMCLPMLKPALFAYGLIHFVLAWQEHLIPLVMITTKENMTVSVALNSLYGGSMHMPYALLMVGSSLTLIPTTLLFLFLFKQFKTSLSELTGL